MARGPLAPSRGAVVTALPCHALSHACGVHRTPNSNEPGHSFNLKAFAPSHPLKMGFQAGLQPVGRGTRGHGGLQSVCSPKLLLTRSPLAGDKGP